MTTINHETLAPCSHCGAKAVSASVYPNDFRTTFACGTIDHGYGNDRSPRCIQDAIDQMKAPAAVIVAVDTDVVLAPDPKASLESQVAAWTATTELAVAAALKAADGITVAKHADGPAKGRKAAEAARLSIKRVRTPIEKRRKELKAPIIALGELVDAEARRLSAPLISRETELDAECTAYDAEQARIKREAEEAEKARVQTRLNQVVALGGEPDVVAITAMADDVFAKLVETLAEKKRIQDEEAKAIRERTASRLAQMDAVDAQVSIAWLETATDEEFAQRLGVATSQYNLKRAEEEEFQREKDQLEADRKALAKEREDLEREKADIQAALDAKEKAEQDEKDRIAAQEKAQADAQAEVERLAKEDADRIAAQAAADALRAAQAPDREKIAAWAMVVRNTIQPLPDIADADLAKWASDARDDILNTLTILETEMKENA